MRSPHAGQHGQDIGACCMAAEHPQQQQLQQTHLKVQWTANVSSTELVCLSGLQLPLPLLRLLPRAEPQRRHYNYLLLSLPLQLAFIFAAAAFESYTILHCTMHHAIINENLLNITKTVCKMRNESEKNNTTTMETLLCQGYTSWSQRTHVNVKLMRHR